MHFQHGNIEANTLLIDVATRNVICLAPGDSIGMAARIMAEKRISSILVTDHDGSPAGIVTESNVLRAMLSKSPQETKLQEVMSSPVITVPDSMTCLDAYQSSQRNGIRHLVVVDDKKCLLGIVSETDFRLHINLKVLSGRRLVASAMSRSVFSLKKEDRLLDALKLMQLHRDTCVVIVDSGRPVGILTERDIVRLYSLEPARTEVTLGEVMATPVLTIPVDRTTREAADLMLGAKIRHLVVVDEAGQLAGLISEHDLTQTMVQGLIDEKSAVDGLLLRTLIDTIPDLVWLKDVHGAYLACNPSFERFFGAREKDIVGKTDADFMEAKLVDSFLEHDRRTMQHGGPSVSEEWVTYAGDGHRELLETVKTPMYDEQGKLIGVLSIARDITKRKQAEEALAQSESRYRMLVENAPFCIHEIDLQGRLQSMNHAGLDMLGLDNENKICGLPYLNSVSEQDNSHIKALMQAAFKGIPSHFEFTSAGENPRYFKSCFIPIRDAVGGVIKLMGITEDVTQRKQTENALREREEIFSTIVNQAADSIVLIDSETMKLVEFNQVAHESLGYTRAEFATLRLPDIQAQLTTAEIRQRMQQSIAKNDSLLFETLHRRKNGTVRETWISSRPVIIHGKTYISGIWIDITERKLAEENLRITASVFDISKEAIVITDANNTIIDVNPAFTSITGYSRDEVLGKNPKILGSRQQDEEFYIELWKSLKENKTWRGEIWNRRKSGEVYAEMLSISVICDNKGMVKRHVGVFSDITYFKDHEAELNRIANYDALTGIPNRRLLADRLRQAIVHAQRNQKLLAICYLDLDGFKNVNDLYGHEAGDKLLINISRRLQEILRAGDTLARLGGDEFVVLFNDLSREQECFQVLDRILGIVTMPVDIGNHLVTVSTSIGLAFYPSDNVDGDTLLRHADQAMYVAKQTGKNRYHLYDSVHDQRGRALHESRRRILRGLDENEFELFYQPKIVLATGDVAGVEALIRWRHPERGLLHPAEFLPDIEDSDLEIQLGEWVMDTAMAQLDKWHQAGLALEVSINISARHLQSPDFVTSLARRLARHPDFPCDKLQIEVLETAALEDIAHSSEIIEACRKLGVHFALDDFGTGYSSLACLRKLSVETLKIDQSFIRGMLADSGDRAIVKGIIALAKTFGRKTVAEGMEAKELTQALIDAGCVYGQGYGIAQPMSARDFLKWHRERK